MAFTEFHKSYLAHEQAMLRERGGPRHATFAQKPPAPRPAPAPRTPSIQEQLNALSVGIYESRRTGANREAFEARMAQEVLNKPFKLCGDSIYKRRAAEIQAHRLAARGNPPERQEQQTAPVMPDAESIYRRRQREARGAA